MQVLENIHNINFMTWETDPKKRSGSALSFYQDKNSTVKEGDLLVGSYGDLGVSTYEVTEVKEVREGNMSGKNYTTVICDWGLKPSLFFKGLLSESNSGSFLRLTNNL